MPDPFKPYQLAGPFKNSPREKGPFDKGRDSDPSLLEEGDLPLYGDPRVQPWMGPVPFLPKNYHLLDPNPGPEWDDPVDGQQKTPAAGNRGRGNREMQANIAVDPDPSATHHTEQTTQLTGPGQPRSIRNIYTLDPHQLTDTELGIIPGLTPEQQYAPTATVRGLNLPGQQLSNAFTGVEQGSPRWRALHRELQGRQMENIGIVNIDPTTLPQWAVPDPQNPEKFLRPFIPAIPDTDFKQAQQRFDKTSEMPALQTSGPPFIDHEKEPTVDEFIQAEYEKEEWIDFPSRAGEDFAAIAKEKYRPGPTTLGPYRPVYELTDEELRAQSESLSEYRGHHPRDREIKQEEYARRIEEAEVLPNARPLEIKPNQSPGVSDMQIEKDIMAQRGNINGNNDISERTPSPNNLTSQMKNVLPESHSLYTPIDVDGDPGNPDQDQEEMFVLNDDKPISQKQPDPPTDSQLDADVGKPSDAEHAAELKSRFDPKPSDAEHAAELKSRFDPKPKLRDMILTAIGHAKLPLMKTGANPAVTAVTGFQILKLLNDKKRIMSEIEKAKKEAAARGEEGLPLSDVKDQSLIGRIFGGQTGTPASVSTLRSLLQGTGGIEGASASMLANLKEMEEQYGTEAISATLTDMLDKMIDEKKAEAGPLLSFVGGIVGAIPNVTIGTPTIDTESGDLLVPITDKGGDDLTYNEIKTVGNTPALPHGGSIGGADYILDPDKGIAHMTEGYIDDPFNPLLEQGGQGPDIIKSIPVPQPDGSIKILNISTDPNSPLTQQPVTIDLGQGYEGSDVGQLLQQGESVSNTLQEQGEAIKEEGEDLKDERKRQTNEFLGDLKDAGAGDKKGVIIAGVKGSLEETMKIPGIKEGLIDPAVQRVTEPVSRGLGSLIPNLGDLLNMNLLSNDPYHWSFHISPLNMDSGKPPKDVLGGIKDDYENIPVAPLTPFQTPYKLNIKDIKDAGMKAGVEKIVLNVFDYIKTPKGNDQLKELIKNYTSNYIKEKMKTFAGDQYKFEGQENALAVKLGKDQLLAQMNSDAEALLDNFNLLFGDALGENLTYNPGVLDPDPNNLFVPGTGQLTLTQMEFGITYTDSEGKPYTQTPTHFGGLSEHGGINPDLYDFDDPRNLGPNRRKPRR